MANTTFTITFEDGTTASASANILKPEFIKGWWSYDKEGKEVYESEKTDKNGETKNMKVQLGDTVYFHVETRDIVAGEEIEMQLMDYDYFWWLGEHIDEYNIDTSKFPNNTVWKKAKVRGVNGKSVATVALVLEEKWEPVIADDHDDLMSFDQTIELYWRVRYINKKGHKTKKELPEKKDSYLRVGYNEQDLFVKPMVEGSGLPEFYDNKGKLYIFGFKMIAKISKELNPNPYFSSLFISTVRITETNTLTEINKVKKMLLYERVSWDTNESVRFGYKSIQSSNYVIKGAVNFEDVTQFNTEKTKKFTDYFNYRDLKNGKAIAIRKTREALRILDFINASKTVYSIFKEPEQGLQIPKPSSVISAMGLFSAIRAIPSFGALSPLFMAADVIATKVTNEIINEFTEEVKLEWEHRKMAGLNPALAWVQNGKAKNNGAKLLGLDVIEFVSQTAYEKLLRKEFKTFEEFYNYSPSPEDDNKNYYTCFYYTKEENERRKYLIDSIFLR